MRKRKAYTVLNDVIGGSANGQYEYAAGVVTPKDSAERKVLEHLVTIGVAKVGAPAEQKE